jgi:hypothetical protein
MDLIFSTAVGGLIVYLFVFSKFRPGEVVGKVISRINILASKVTAPATAMDKKMNSPAAATNSTGRRKYYVNTKLK